MRVVSLLFTFLLVSCAAGQGQGTMADGTSGEVILPQEQQVIPPQKLYGRTIEMYGAADVEVQYQIEQGKSLDIFVMTAEQEQRYSAGQAGNTPGQDYIRADRAMMANGNVFATVQPGRIVFLFQNASNDPVTVTTTVIARRK